MKLTKKILLSSFAAAMAFSGASFASAPGFYLGGNLGWGTTGAGGSDITGNLGSGVIVNSANANGRGTAWGLNAGYQFDTNWAAELAYTRFAKTNYTAAAGTVNGVAFASGTGSYNQDVVSLVAKGLLPFENGFSAYGKLGAAYVRFSSVNATNNRVSATLGGSNVWRPTAGVGVKYDFNQNVSADIGLTRIFKGGSNMPNNSDTALVGVTYNFG